MKIAYSAALADHNVRKIRRDEGELMDVLGVRVKWKVKAKDMGYAFMCSTERWTFYAWAAMASRSGSGAMRARARMCRETHRMATSTVRIGRRDSSPRPPMTMKPSSPGLELW
jgi:hypothetical protein